MQLNHYSCSDCFCVCDHGVARCARDVVGGDGEEEAGESLVASESAGMEDAVEVAVSPRGEKGAGRGAAGVSCRCVAHEMDAKFELRR